MSVCVCVLFPVVFRVVLKTVRYIYAFYFQIVVQNVIHEKSHVYIYMYIYMYIHVHVYMAHCKCTVCITHWYQLIHKNCHGNIKVPRNSALSKKHFLLEHVTSRRYYLHVYTCTNHSCLFH